MAALPLLDLISDADGQKPSEGLDSWEQVASLERVEVCQATGMIDAAFIASPADVLVKLRAHAVSHSSTASDVDYQIVNRHLAPSRDG